ncbi:bifunctional riboflavin kinase/FAD synthetase [Amphritea sp. 2_MG-2023]|jgi:riboflavin kinase/FMN adenylyltransferase|uniref:bifunctional riboflavin kinase/FAD synthetase n=1 Tax=Amphritea TaxID=515417 RepID=UPI001C078D79|nr:MULTISPECIES: bifunctional riboflavin kinase/FAD synthetase [Amphritea]MBU2963991.1 bifunctional riboflavin kinase/FAD synthetase [Amphritea atlantica]MDO6420305.1 bifunctional riboflavin kinase/FAD synthetase [Amphritea sp. 2_MG-2023]
MELIRGLHNLRDKHKGCVATIGNFDGVHLGHQQVLAQVLRKGKELGLPAVVIIFEPQPREFFAGNQAPPRLTRFDEKVRLLKAQGVDRVLCLTFNERLRTMSADQFVDELLLKGLAVRHFVVGDDFRFGCDRSGDYNMLRQSGERYGFSVVNTETFDVDGERVSSTRIRSALQNNDLALACALLGRPYSVTGRVMHGQELGRTIGVPTANVRMHRFHSPLKGVYAVTVTGKNLSAQGVANIGMRPTVNGKQPVLEAHLFDWSGDLYGQLLTVEFKTFIRPEQKFDGLDALKQQIDNDIQQVRNYFLTGAL